MGAITDNVQFTHIAREWRCKWAEEDDKKTLTAAQAALAPVLLLLCIAGCLAQQQPPSTAGLVSLAALYSALPTAKSRSSQHPLPRHSAVSHLPPLTSPLAVGRVPGPEPGAGRPRDHRREERDLQHLQTHFDRAV